MEYKVRQSCNHHFECDVCTAVFDFKLHRIGVANSEELSYFKVEEHLSDYHQYMLKLFGDSIRQDKSQAFWVGNKYYWYINEHQSAQECVYQTDNGILIYESGGIAYRVEFSFNS